MSDQGVSRCIGCTLCAEICPPTCIRVIPAATEALAARPGAPGEAPGPGQPPALFEIDMARCFSCGLCEEVCPTDALAMSPLVEIAAENRSGLVFGFEALQVPASSLGDRVVLRSESGVEPSAALEVGP
ncbi:MAG: 4Fe-4S dicluster domain-containing protein [Myxococcota bacterium]|nr:4Fe-4S dicluster domain-containing protein [Myxococcota bacterium]